MAGRLTRRYDMSYADAAWLRMDRATNLMVINAVLFFDEPIDWARVRRIVRERVVDCFARFRQRIGFDAFGRPHWEDDPSFDLDVHMHHRALPAPGDDAALQELIGDLMTEPIDRGKALWHAYLIDGFGDGCALVARMHHCIADGISLARVMLLLTDDAPDAGAGFREQEAGAGGGGLRLPLPGLARPAVSMVSAGAALTRRALHEGIETLEHPGHALELADLAARDSRTLAKLLVPLPETPSKLRGEPGVAKRVAWCEPFSLERVKAICRVTDGTVNDVLVSAVAGAFGRWLDARDNLVDELHALVPFNLRPLDEPLPRELGNRFGLLWLTLPVGEREPRARLAAVKARMDEIKGTHEGAIAYGMIAATGVMPTPIQSRAMDVLTASGTTVVTNVPGPREPIYLAGSPVRGVLVWAPVSGSLGTSVAIFSYAGEVTVGFMVDAGLVPEPQALVDALGDELAALEELD